MVADESLIVTQEALRQRARYLARIVAGSALPSFPLLAVLVAAETLAHGRERRFTALHHARVAANTLPLDLGHAKVLVVVERDGRARRRRFRCKLARGH
jgi:hypothetical protein